MIVRNRSPYGPRYRIVRAPKPEVYLTDVLIDVVVIWAHGLRCVGALLLGVGRGVAAELRTRRLAAVEDGIAEIVAQIKRERRDYRGR